MAEQLFMGVPGTDGIDHSDPIAVLKAISAPPQAAPATGTPQSPIAPPPAAAPPASDRWRALMNLVAPVAGFFGSPNPAGQAAFMNAWSELEQKHTADTKQKQEAGAKYLLEVGQHAMGLTDPAQFNSFIKLAEEAGTRAGWIKPGDLQRQIQFPTSQFAQAKVAQLSDELDGLEKNGYNLDELAKAGAQITMKDGTRVPIATALDLTRKRPLMNGQPVVRPSKADTAPSTDFSRYLAKFAKEQGKTVDQLTTAEENTARTQFNSDKPVPATKLPVGGVDAQFNDLVELWKEGHPGQEPPASVRTRLRAQANTVNDRPAPAAPALGGLDDDGLDYAATIFRLTNRMPPQGRQSNGAYQAIVNRAAKQAKDLGQSPAVAIQKQLALKSDAAALTRLSTMAAAADAFESKALAQADIVESLSNKVDRTNYPIINDGLLTGKARIAGDANTQLLFNALTTFTTEYAKIMSGATGSSGASSDSSRREAQSLISASLNKGTLSQTLDLMRREMRLTMQGYDIAKQHVSENMGGAPAAAPAAAPVNRVYYDANGNPVKK